MLLSISRMSPRWLYMVMFFLLQLTQLSSQLSTKISTIKNFQISYMYNENRTTFATFANTCTERVTHFGPSSGRHTHASRAYFFSMSRYCNFPIGFAKLRRTKSSCARLLSGRLCWSCSNFEVFFVTGIYLIVDR